MQQGDVPREVELQNLLSDERTRCTQYKQIYQILKEKHARLQEELTTIHQQLQHAVERSNQIKVSNEQYINKLEKIVKEKQSEIGELTEKLKSIHPDEIKQRILEDASKHYEEAINQTQAEAVKNREKYTHLHYEHTILKCQLDYIESENSRILEVAKLQHLSEIEELKSKIEALEEEEKAPVKDYSVELKKAEREILQLNSRLKVLLSECDELRARNEKAALQTDGLTRVHSKQLAEHAANIRALESEKSTTSMQKEVIQKELNNCQDQRNTVNNQLQDAKQEVLTLKNQLDDYKHKYELHMANLQIETQRYKGEQEAEKEKLTEELAKLNLELKHLKDEVNEHKRTILEKEHDVRRQIQAAKQQTWQERNEFEQEKERIELKMKDIEVLKNEAIAHVQLELKKSKQELKNAVETKRETEQNLLVMKTKLEESLKRSDSKVYDDLSKQNSEFKNEIEMLKEKVSQLSENKKELEIHREKLLDETSTFKKIESDDKVSHHKELMQLQISIEQQKHQFQQRIDDLESQLKERQNAWNVEKKEIQNKLKQYARLITKLRDRLEIQKALVEELEVEKEFLKKNIPIEDHIQVKRQLSELKRKQEEFHQVMIAASQFTVNSAMPSSTMHHLDKKISLSTLPSQVSLNGENFLHMNKQLEAFNKEQSETQRLPTRVHRRPSRKLNAKITKTIDDRHSSSSDVESL